MSSGLYVSQLQSFTKAIKDQLCPLEFGDGISRVGESVVRVPANSNIFSRSVRSLARTATGLKTEEEIKGYKGFIEKLQQLLAQKDPSGFDCAFNGQNYLPELYRLNKYALRYLEKGAKNYAETCEKAPLDITSRTEEVYKDRRAQAEAVAVIISSQIVPKVRTMISKIEEVAKDNASVTTLADAIIERDKPVRVKPGITYSLASVKEVLSGYYGKRVVDEMVKAYHLSTKGFVDAKDINALMIGIVANLNPDDIIFIFTRPGTVLPKCKTSEQKYYPKKFEELTHGDFCNFIDKVRDVNRTVVDGAGKKYAAQLTKDLAFLDVTSSTSALYQMQKESSGVLSLKGFRWADYLTEVVGQLVVKKTMFSAATFVSGFNEAGNRVFNNIFPVFKADDLSIVGMVPYVLAHDKATEVVTIKFVVNCPENTSPAAFKTHSDAIKKGISEFVDMVWFSNEDKKVQLRVDVIGSGTAGRFAQECVALLGEMMLPAVAPAAAPAGAPAGEVALEEKTLHLNKKIVQLNLFAFGTQGIDRKLAQKFLVDMETVQKDVNLRYFQVSAPVKEGKALLGFFEKDLSANISVSLFDIGFKAAAPATPPTARKALVMVDERQSDLRAMYSNNAADLGLVTFKTETFKQADDEAKDKKVLAQKLLA